MLLRVAWFYYKDELTQDEIAQRLSISRASVGRMLDRARKVGLVSINLNSEFLDSMNLAARLVVEFELSAALVVPARGDITGIHAINARVGLGGAQYLSTHLKRGLKLGIGFGETVSQVVRTINFGMVGIDLVTLTGGVNGYLHPVMTTQVHAEFAPTGAVVIPSPIVTSTPELAQALRAEPTISKGLERARSVDIAVVGVGTATPDATIVQYGYLDAPEMELLAERNVVGDIMGQFFDSNGTVVDLPIHARRIGIELPDLKLIPMVIGVAGGLQKVDAIRGALRGRYLDVLVTDEAVAKRLLTR